MISEMVTNFVHMFVLVGFVASVWLAVAVGVWWIAVPALIVASSVIG